MEYIELNYCDKSYSSKRLRKGTENYYKFLFKCPEQWSGKQVAKFASPNQEPEYLPIINGACDFPNRFSNEERVAVTVISVDGNSKMESKEMILRMV